jgi:hypothetical protein
VNPRQLHALTHPLGGPADLGRLDELTSYRQRGDGSLLQTILAVDR